MGETSGYGLIGVRMLIRLPPINLVMVRNLASGIGWAGRLVDRIRFEGLVERCMFVFISLRKDYHKLSTCQLNRCLISLIKAKAIYRGRYMGLGF